MPTQLGLMRAMSRSHATSQTATDAVTATSATTRRTKVTAVSMVVLAKPVKREMSVFLVAAQHLPRRATRLHAVVAAMGCNALKATSALLAALKEERALCVMMATSATKTELANPSLVTRPAAPMVAVPQMASASSLHFKASTPVATAAEHVTHVATTLSIVSAESASKISLASISA
jgi:hypothetical protein